MVVARVVVGSGVGKLLLNTETKENCGSGGSGGEEEVD